MQTSQVFSQRAWPAAGDVDDCWVVSTIQALNVTSPWAQLVGTSAFRAAAGKPDHPGQSDGGSLADIMRAIGVLWPAIAPAVMPLKGVPWVAFARAVDAGRPCTVAVKSMYLPAPLQYGFGGYHQVTVAKRGARYLFANPLAPDRSAWDQLGALADIQEAVLRYGADTANARVVYAAAMPDELAALKLHPQYGIATAQLQAQVDGCRKVISEAKSAAQDCETALQGFIGAVTL